VRSLLVVERDIAADEVLGFACRLVGAQINLLVLNRSPKALDEHVVAPGALTVHADSDATTFERCHEVLVGELRTLVAVEDDGAAEARNRLLQRIDAEVGRQAVRKSPRQNFAREPIQNGNEIKKALMADDNYLGRPCCLTDIGYRVASVGMLLH